MTIDWKIEKPAQRILVVALTAGIIALLGYMGVSNLVVGMMTGGVEDGSRQRLETAASYFPNSPRLNAQLARSELTSADRDLSAAESFARRAVELSPNDYNFQLLLATIQVVRAGDCPCAKQCRAALAAREPAAQAWLD
jgi:Tfp pilus assembly protein PilF